MLRKLPDPRNQSYITYSSQVLLMARILSSIFYSSSIRKTSEEFNSEVVIENIGYLCGKPELKELPYWETINDYLKRLEPTLLQELQPDTVISVITEFVENEGYETEKQNCKRKAGRGTVWSTCTAVIIRQ